jgi:GNAT superfamily N-acetyltransferase
VYTHNPMMTNYLQTIQALPCTQPGTLRSNRSSDSLYKSEFKGLEKVVVNSPEEFEPVWEIMQSEFPCNELRTKEAQFDLLQNSKYTLFAFKNATLETVAFLSLWQFDAFCFLEHFAVKRKFQSFGYGSLILKDFVQTKKRIILEVEDPLYSKNPVICEKRIQFYTRLGFVTTDMCFVQPALKPNDVDLPHLVLMTLKSVNLEFECIYRILKESVY